LDFPKKKGQVWLLFHIEFQKSSIRSTHFGYVLLKFFPDPTEEKIRVERKLTGSINVNATWQASKQASKQSEKEIQSAIKTDVTGQCTK
jgi:hypothetical protein